MSNKEGGHGGHQEGFVARGKAAWDTLVGSKKKKTPALENVDATTFGGRQGALRKGLRYATGGKGQALITAAVIGIGSHYYEGVQPMRTIIEPTAGKAWDAVANVFVESGEETKRKETQAEYFKRLAIENEARSQKLELLKQLRNERRITELDYQRQVAKVHKENDEANKYTPDQLELLNTVKKQREKKEISDEVYRLRVRQITGEGDEAQPDAGMTGDTGADDNNGATPDAGTPAEPAGTPAGTGAGEGGGAARKTDAPKKPGGEKGGTDGVEVKESADLKTYRASAKAMTKAYDDFSSLLKKGPDGKPMQEIMPGTNQLWLVPVEGITMDALKTAYARLAPEHKRHCDIIKGLKDKAGISKESTYGTIAKECGF